MPEPKVVPVEETKDTKAVETKTESKKDDKIGKVLDVKDKKVEEPKMVPEAILIEYKKENKEIHKELNDLKALIESGATKKEVSADLKVLAEKHGVAADFLEEFAAAVRKEAKADADRELQPIKDGETAAKRETVFNEHFDKTLIEMPEYSKIVNKNVIRTLVFDPKNANKTFAQIFEESFGHLITGKKTIDTTKARGGKDATIVDVARAQRDPEYFKEIMADPELKKKYNEGLGERLRI